MNERVIIEIRDLKKYFPITGGLLKHTVGYIKAVDGVNLTIQQGETLGLVGESGCGKSTLGRCILRLIEPTQGQILFHGEDLMKLTPAQMRNEREHLQIIFQDPYSSLDSRFTVGRCIREPLDVQKIGTPAERNARAEELMQEVGLSHEQLTRYPHEFSGGQRQRIGIARALALNPSLIICDEPVSALDVSIQAQILNLMQELKEKHGLTYIFISHNLSVVHHLCDRIAVMYLGNVVEIAEKRQLFENPQHPYTKALLEAVPIPDPEREIADEELQGDVPSPLHPPAGCCFHTRCKFACEKCSQVKPILTEIESGHQVACHLMNQTP